MSQSEKRMVDTRGKFVVAVKSGRKLNDVSWNSCRILLSDKRLILARDNNKKQIVLNNIKNITDRVDVSSKITTVSEYTGIRTLDNNVILISARDQDEIELSFYKALLDNNTVLAKHPAIEGGVISGVNWSKARIQVNKESIAVALKNGKFVELDYKSISDIEKNERSIGGESRNIVSITHAIENTSYETYLATSKRKVEFIYSFLDKGQDQTESNIELSNYEEEVVMALYSGVSPFEVPEFSDMDIDEVEDIYEKLIEQDVLDEVRTRKEVSLTSRGRNLASDAISEE